MRYENELNQLLSEDLPALYLQKRKPYRPSMDEVVYTYKILNKELFNSKLFIPNIIFLNRPKKYVGECKANTSFPEYTNKSNCAIYLTKNWYCRQFFIAMLAHEMVHQYQWDIESRDRIKNKLMPTISHGPTFYKHRKKFLKFNLPLKKTFRIDYWFKYQNLLKI